MSEYIVCVDDLEESYYRYTDIQPKTVFGHRLREEIVRCRDCVDFERWDYADGNTRNVCARFEYLDVTPDGYCAWGIMK